MGSEATGGIFLSGAIIIGGLGALVGTITYLFAALMKSKDGQIDDLRIQATAADLKIDLLNGRLTTGLETMLRETQQQHRELAENVLAKIKDFEELLAPQ